MNYNDELVNHPNHYTSGNIEVIDVIEEFTKDLSGIKATDTGNIIKYMLRWNKKNGIQDLKKAHWYLEHLIKHVQADIDKFEENVNPPEPEEETSNKEEPVDFSLETKVSHAVNTTYEDKLSQDYIDDVNRMNAKLHCPDLMVYVPKMTTFTDEYNEIELENALARVQNEIEDIGFVSRAEIKSNYGRSDAIIPIDAFLGYEKLREVRWEFDPLTNTYKICFYGDCVKLPLEYAEEDNK